MKTWTHYKITATRYSSPASEQASAVTIYFGCQSPGCWRFVVDCDGFRQVGQMYKSKDELLADLPRYAEVWGFK